MNLNDILLLKGIAPEKVIVLRYRPTEPKLNNVLIRLAAKKPEIFKGRN